MVQPINVGYIRWSSDAQEDGDSERRQRNSITRDAAHLGVTITRWLRDEGLSASTGENITKGELGRFLGEVRAGQVPRGSILFLDEATRLTRLSPSKAMRILADLEDAGVTIRLSARGQSMSGDGLYELLGFLIETASGHAFTKELGRKVHEAWLAKRDGARKAPGKEVLTSNTPYGIAAVGGTYAIGKGWNGRRYEPHPQESPIVVLIFKWARDGFSPRRIATMLNEKGAPSPHASRGRKCKTGRHVWRAETVRDILHDRAYCDGSYQPCRGSSKKGKSREGNPVAGHYPVFLESGLWEAANTEIGTRSFIRKSQTHRSAAGNLFTGLMKCAHCRGPISLRSTNDKGRIPALYCFNARTGACTMMQAVHRSKVEGAVLAALATKLCPEEILSDLNRAEVVIDRNAVLERLRQQLREREKEVARLTDRILQLSDSENLDLYEERLTKARQDREELRRQVLVAEREAELATAETSQNVRAATDFRALVSAIVLGSPVVEFSGSVDGAKLQAVIRQAEKLQTKFQGELETARVKLKAAIRRLVSGMTFNLHNERFNIELHGRGLIYNGLGERKHAEKCELMPEYMAMEMPEDNKLQPLQKTRETVRSKPSEAGLRPPSSEKIQPEHPAASQEVGT